MSKLKNNVAIIGTQGIPNKYGGFETLVEYLVEHLASEVNLTVICSSKVYTHKPRFHKGCRLHYINFKANGIQSVLYDSYSLYKTLKKYDKVLILGTSAGLIMPIISGYRNKFVLNIGGVDWKRSKWNFIGKLFLKYSEYMMIKYSDTIISDNKGIKEYVFNRYHRKSRIIPYGGDHAFRVNITEKYLSLFPFLSEKFAFGLARIQADNNIDIILEVFKGNSDMLLVFVGNWDSNNYGRSLKEKYRSSSNIKMIDAIYKKEMLNVLRSNCSVYIHGHSAGGTNPALVEAMYLGLPLFAYASIYNRHTTEDKAQYWNNGHDLEYLINNKSQVVLDIMGKELQEIAKNKYTWKIVTSKYKELLGQG